MRIVVFIEAIQVDTIRQMGKYRSKGKYFLGQKVIGMSETEKSP